MKTKIFLVAALVGAAAMSANAGVRFGFSLEWPLPVVVPTPVVCAMPVTPVPATVVQMVPPCPGADYVWVPGCWSYGATSPVWVSGAWCYRPAHLVYGHHHAGYRW